MPINIQARKRKNELRFRVIGDTGRYITKELTEDQVRQFLLDQEIKRILPGINFQIQTAKEKGTSSAIGYVPLKAKW